MNLLLYKIIELPEGFKDKSVEAMTADWANLQEEILRLISNRIINEVKGINRVVYDISSKPPSTIEWE